MIIDVEDHRLIKSQLHVMSNEPLWGLLIIETDGGIFRFKLDEESASQLLDETLALFGVPRPEDKLKRIETLNSQAF